ncbi:MAG: hypothetical protein K5872_12545 [Rhizobiaceae bacterium]|nr:hypothetical protein [Rhizobiaceae bacterium]MCV0407045.1 hypothetical protein [Rhizobiaceae bacterium]
MWQSTSDKLSPRRVILGFCLAVAALVAAFILEPKPDEALMTKWLEGGVLDRYGCALRADGLVGRPSGTAVKSVTMSRCHKQRRRVLQGRHNTGRPLVYECLVGFTDPDGVDYLVAFQARHVKKPVSYPRKAHDNYVLHVHSLYETREKFTEINMIPSSARYGLLREASPPPKGTPRCR